MSDLNRRINLLETQFPLPQIGVKFLLPVRAGGRIKDNLCKVLSTIPRFSREQLLTNFSPTIPLFLCGLNLGIWKG